MKSIRIQLMTASAVAFFAGSAFAYDYTVPGLYEQADGSITYVTGGIGEMERTELEDAKASYNFHLTNASKDGAYVSDTAIVIEDRKGNDVLATNTGPLLFATLPAGKYTVMAENQGVVQTKTVTLGAKKSAYVSFIWNVAE